MLTNTSTNFPVSPAAISLPNEFCSPRPTVMAIGYPEFKSFPFFVTLHRCIGSCNNIQPTILRCVPTKVNPVQIQTISVSGTGLEVITKDNHTECGHECVAQPSHCDPDREVWEQDQCECVCKFKDTPAKPCGKGFVWNNYRCKCVCDKAPRICPLSKVSPF